MAVIWGMNNADTPMNMGMNYGMNHLISCYCMNNPLSHLM